MKINGNNGIIFGTHGSMGSILPSRIQTATFVLGLVFLNSPQCLGQYKWTIPPFIRHSCTLLGGLCTNYFLFSKLRSDTLLRRARLVVAVLGVFSHRLDLSISTLAGFIFWGTKMDGRKKNEAGSTAGRRQRWRLAVLLTSCSTLMLLRQGVNLSSYEVVRVSKWEAGYRFTGFLFTGFRMQS